jgi:hypothetical protein
LKKFPKSDILKFYMPLSMSCKTQWFFLKLSIIKTWAYFILTNSIIYAPTKNCILKNPHKRGFQRGYSQNIWDKKWFRSVRQLIKIMLFLKFLTILLLNYILNI